ncbi:hypothetical protein THAOC_21840 [Thalassiosira oceanica]|uniref:Uncharacterized protein n=1 Tax=Thalassiosira oceanica TaxID=159749 RepID=K0SAS8_THAOC|nr:hypothetical protein THAOC_21840 [Thalassiosira oceanica]|eukprot:EJK58061.1 hypothetical protein THAOC_21840 [Thalassiosira oceanica]
MSGSAGRYAVKNAHVGPAGGRRGVLVPRVVRRAASASVAAVVQCHAGRVGLDLEDPPPLGAAGEGEAAGEAAARRAVGGGRDLYPPQPLELAGELGPDEVTLTTRLAWPGTPYTYLPHGEDIPPSHLAAQGAQKMRFERR